MTDQPVPDRALSFGSVAEAYDRGRPDYPDDAVRWLVSQEAATVLELGAGTGKLTRTLIAHGHDVHASEPDQAMLEILRRNLPEVRSSRNGAEEIPAPDNSFDVVIVAQAFHWFDHARAIPEIARVLKNGGHLALVWNERDGRIPWVRRLGDLIGNQEQLRDPVPAIEAPYDHLHWFQPVESKNFKHWQNIDPDILTDMVRSRSHVATMDEEARAEKLSQVREFYAEYGRGYDGMQLPYVTACYRAQVIDRLMNTTPGAVDDEPITSDGSDSDVLLIDFR